MKWGYRNQVDCKLYATRLLYIPKATFRTRKAVFTVPRHFPTPSIFFSPFLTRSTPFASLISLTLFSSSSSTYFSLVSFSIPLVLHSLHSESESSLFTHTSLCHLQTTTINPTGHDYFKMPLNRSFRTPFKRRFSFYDWRFQLQSLVFVWNFLFH